MAKPPGTAGRGPTERYGMMPEAHRSRGLTSIRRCTLGASLGSVIKKRRKKMRKHKHKKMLKKTRWQRRARA
jgi:hypothetical protein